MTTTCAILPIKAFERAKTRLRPLLDQSQCASLARMMAIDMLKVLRAVPELDRVIVLGQGDEQATLARIHGCDYVADDPCLDISQNLTRLFRALGSAHQMLFIAADLPLVTASDVGRLFKSGHAEITICRASRDGGTNALLACPAADISFSFGCDSAKRHAVAAVKNNRSVEVLDETAFQRDVDVPDDLYWISRNGMRGATIEYLSDLITGAMDPQLLPKSMAS